MARNADTGRGAPATTAATTGEYIVSGSRLDTPPKTAAFVLNHAFRCDSLVALLCSSPQMISCFTPGSVSGYWNCSAVSLAR